MIFYSTSRALVLPNRIKIRAKQFSASKNTKYWIWVVSTRESRYRKKSQERFLFYSSSQAEESGGKFSFRCIVSHHKFISVNFHRKNSSPRKAIRRRKAADFADNRVTGKWRANPMDGDSSNNQETPRAEIFTCRFSASRRRARDMSAVAYRWAIPSCALVCNPPQIAPTSEPDLEWRREEGRRSSTSLAWSQKNKLDTRESASLDTEWYREDRVVRHARHRIFSLCRIK